MDTVVAIAGGRVQQFRFGGQRSITIQQIFLRSIIFQLSHLSLSFQHVTPVYYNKAKLFPALWCYGFACTCMFILHGNLLLKMHVDFTA